MEFTHTLDLVLPPPTHLSIAYWGLSMAPNALVYSSLHQINQRISRRQERYNHVTPRLYLDL